MRIQVELKREAIPQVVLNKLYKHTSLQTTFGYNAVALVDGVPRTLSLLELVRHYLDFQRGSSRAARSSSCARRRSARTSSRATSRARQPRRGRSRSSARRPTRTRRATGLMERFELTEIQAQAILDLRLARLTGLERKEIEDEYADLQERIAELAAILSDEAQIDGSSARSCSRSRRSTARATTGERRSSRPRATSSWRT
jgi:DNA gyrase subunit A